jgi:hypothetical protein
VLLQLQAIEHDEYLCVCWSITAVFSNAICTPLLQVQRLVECPGHSLVVVGDAEQCRMALVNDSKHWVEEMGTCPRLATGCCTCSR